MPSAEPDPGDVVRVRRRQPPGGRTPDRGRDAGTARRAGRPVRRGDRRPASTGAAGLESRAPALRTREDLREHFASAGARTGGLDRFEPVDTVVHTTSDPEVVVVEFAYAGSAGGRDFRLPCVFVVRVRDGRIVESRDYADHGALTRR